MIITIAIAFIVCWTPFYLVIFISQLQKVSFLQKSNFIFTMLATHLSGFLNSAINPFIYHFMSEKFRKSFISILRSFLCCPLHLWQKKSEPSYSWAMKCEEDYCQHRFEKQRSTSSHSHSKQEFGGNPLIKYKLSPTLSAQQVKTRPKPDHLALRDSSDKSIQKDQYKRKEVTIVKSKQTTSLYCGPFCVCECQGCSIQSSSSQPSSSHPSTKIPVQGPVDTLTEYQSLIHNNLSGGKRQKQSGKTRNNKMELQSITAHQNDETEENTTAFRSRKKAEGTTEMKNSKILNGLSLNAGKASYQSHSDSNIYKKEMSTKTDIPRTSVSSNHLLLPTDQS